ncbi:methyltransferase domain-containing protein [Dyella humicola]|uniref:methyltransferase domain-containing protein n=1 Tax=Dyella humicola TaxID=2992126 RepID=UPI00225055F8|nr:methyltransferase domain-containing protein [Dyella humicola]
MRSIAHILTTELFGESIALPDLPMRKDLSGVGMSCWEGYATPLAERLNFTNTFYHQEPRLDITDISDANVGQYDFITSTDVFEHVAPPVRRAFVNARRLLKVGGVFVFSVPYDRPGKWWAQTIERFPDLHEYEVVHSDGHSYLKNTTRRGKVQVFNELVFHGGEGATLEMRLFSERSLLREFLKAGFNRIFIYRQPYLPYGLYWKNDKSISMAARVVLDSNTRKPLRPAITFI